MDSIEVGQINDRTYLVILDDPHKQRLQEYADKYGQSDADAMFNIVMTGFGHAECFE